MCELDRGGAGDRERTTLPTSASRCLSRYRIFANSAEALHSAGEQNKNTNSHLQLAATRPTPSLSLLILIFPARISSSLYVPNLEYGYRRRLNLISTHSTFTRTMPVPPLPLEMVAQIVTELRLSCVDARGEDLQDERRRNGLAIALVCKAWVPLGEAMVWGQVVLTSSEMVQSLVEHLEEQQHLVKLVQDVTFATNYDADRASEDEGEEAGSEFAIRRLFTLCHTSLLRLDLNNAHWLEPDLFVEELSKCTTLRTLAFCPAPFEQTTLYLFLETLPTLPELEYLSVIIAYPVPAPYLWPELPSTPPLALERVKLVSFNGGEGGRSFNEHVLSLVKPETLQSLITFLEPPDVTIIDRILLFPNLVDLTLTTKHDAQVGPSLEHLFDGVSKAGRRLSITVSPVKIDDAPPEPLLEFTSGNSLADLLALVPACVTELRLNNLHVVKADVPPLTDQMAAVGGLEALAEHLSTIVECGVVDLVGGPARPKAFVGFSLEERLHWLMVPPDE